MLILSGSRSTVQEVFEFWKWFNIRVRAATHSHGGCFVELNRIAHLLFVYVYGLVSHISVHG